MDFEHSERTREYLSRVRAFMDQHIYPNEELFKQQIEADTGIKPAFAMETFKDVDQDVRQSMARIHASPYIPNKQEVRGFVYDVSSGHLREVT